jgi:hypothetical protein
MEIGPINPVNAADKALAAWLVVREALDAVTPPTTDGVSTNDKELPLVPPGIHGEHPLTALVSEPALPGMDSDFSHEAATVQTTWRAPTPAADVPHIGDVGPPATPAAQSDLAVPAALLVPAMLTGLRVEPAPGWAQLPPGPPQWPAAQSEREARQPPRRQHDGNGAPRDDEPPAAAPQESPHEREPAAPETVLDAVEAGAWSDALSRALRTALGARIVPQALLAAADQWKRGRCVVLACPQGDDPAGPAWAFVLWPLVQGQHTSDGVANELALRGLRVEARLQWSAPAHRDQWCHVRVVKEHHPRTGRQLVALDEAANTPSRNPVPCEVQLGPVLARSLRWCQVCVRIQAAQRFWAALGTQWSVHVVVHAEPLLPPPPSCEGPSC